MIILPGPQSLEEEFHEELHNLYWQCGREIGYWPSYFLRGVRKHGGVPYAKSKLKRGESLDAGLLRLKSAGKLHWSLEACVLKQKYAPLFTRAELEEARHRLARCGG